MRLRLSIPGSSLQTATAPKLNALGPADLGGYRELNPQVSKYFIHASHFKNTKNFRARLSCFSDKGKKNMLPAGSIPRKASSCLSR
ncbi:hypothetical protein CO026_00800 [Candidatus Kaiserbacteria bacterium CG_4_9_14_0_2_um_filter_41_32]|uniref:Uncharacterized protein n=1 Tax=Candidatus Kaiserbacteria bacterium CG_4_9_14_0_2_um_filter_41_32 TaxID=1974601 RepID=A0A2M8FFE2_9BACT|nr:MAG: hypothetical protein CO026_00800 [Candidatus Kaiserbacteria bacterium CG_4_9_14_0_2_um_filter_41_32]